jgi:hypothetical protein
MRIRYSEVSPALGVLKLLTEIESVLGKFESGVTVPTKAPSCQLAGLVVPVVANTANLSFRVRSESFLLY